MNMTFQKGMTQLQNEGNYIANTPIADFKAPFNIFDMNTIEDQRQTIPKQTETLATLLASIFFIIYNGSYSLLDQMIKIDKSFVLAVIGHGDNIIETVLIVTLTCCGVILIIINFYIPYFL